MSAVTKHAKIWDFASKEFFSAEDWRVTASTASCCCGCCGYGFVVVVVVVVVAAAVFSSWSLARARRQSQFSQPKLLDSN